MSDIVPLDPVLKLAVTIRLSYRPYETVGDMGKGVRRIMNVTGGTFEIRAQKGVTFETPEVKGAVIGGFDWQILHSERLASLDTRFQLRSDDGHLIYVRAEGRRYASPENLKKLFRGEPVQRGRRFLRRRIPRFYG